MSFYDIIFPRVVLENSFISVAKSIGKLEVRSGKGLNWKLESLTKYEYEIPLAYF